MADDDIYDIMPHKEIADLKKQLSEMKGTKANSPELVKSMTALSQSMDSMLRLFSEAAEELKLEGKEESELSENLEPLHDKLDEILDNKTIAEGMVAISDMIKDFMEKTQGQKIEPMKETGFGAPSFGYDPFADIPKSEQPSPMPRSAPFSPSGPEQQKRGIFGRLKK